jgi:hypothetical protein
MPNVINEPDTSLIGFDNILTPPKDFKHFAIWINIVLEYRVPYPAFCEGHQSPLQAIWDAYNDEFDYGIWLAMRGSGKTQNLAILCFMESIFKPNCWTTVLGGSLEQSQNIIRYLEILWSKPLIPKNLLNGKVNGRGYKCLNGSWVKALPASMVSVRGPHPERLRLDEVDEMDPNLFDAALGQPMDNCGIPAQTLVSSTLQYAHGLMAEIVDHREEKNGKLYSWCVKEVEEPCGFWTHEMVEKKRKLVPKTMWDAEYLLSRPKLEGAIWDYVSIERSYNRGLVLRNNDYSRCFVTGGVDWGFTCSILHLFVELGNRFIMWQTHIFENMELTEKCEEMAKICQSNNVQELYLDSNPKDDNVTCLKIFKFRRVQTAFKPIQFNQFKKLGIQVVRFMFEKNLLDICDHRAKLKLQEYHWCSSRPDTPEKVDDHHSDALIAWATNHFDLLPSSSYNPSAKR